MRGERIMAKAGLKSDKPIDVFKVKAKDIDKPGADLPLMAYRELVVTQRREGLYVMPCALGQYITRRRYIPPPHQYCCTY